MANFAPLPDLAPGPRKNDRVPDPLPAGVLPPDDSRLWLFTKQAIANGEKIIQDDTREWFQDHGFKVQIRRDYPDHPRWMVGPKARQMTGRMHNNRIVSEVHVLVRVHNDLPPVPDWAYARATIRQLEGDLAYRLTKDARRAWVNHGKTALEDMARRAPSQFVNFVAKTFIPKKVEVQEVKDNPTKDALDTLIEAVNRQLRVLEGDMKVINDVPMDYDPNGDIVANTKAMAKGFEEASGTRAGIARMKAPKQLLESTRKVKDVLHPAADPIIEVTEEEAKGWDFG